MKISREVKIGALVLVTLAAGFWGFNFLKGVNIFGSTRTYYAVYNEVDGLNISSPVSVNGFNVGSVTGIRLIPEQPGKILVSFRISNGDFAFPDDSEARIESASLLGSKRISIVLGSSSNLAQSGDTLNSGIEEGLQASVNKVVLPLKDKVEKLIGTVDSILTPIQGVMTPKTMGSISEAIQTLPDIINNIKRVTGRLDDLVASEKDRLSRILGNVESLTATLKNNNGKISSILANVDNITDSLAKSNLKQTIQNATSTLAKVDSIVGKINRGEGTLGALINDKKLYNDLDSAVANVNDLIADLKENPERYVHLSLFHINKKVTPPKPKKNQTAPPDSTK